MADLATTSDLAARLGRSLTGTETTRAAPYLKDASALVRKYTGQTFALVTNDAVILRPVGAFLVLEQLPVTAVDSVSGVDEDGTVGDPITGWVFDGIDRIDITRAGFGFIASPWWPWPDGPESFQVVYDHGPAAVPDDVIGIVCGMVLDVLLSPSLVAGLNTERVGQYSYGMQQGVGGTPGASVRLSEQNKADLKHYRTQAGSVQVRV